MKKTFLLGNAGAFVLLAVAGTLTHELGHFAMATALGYPATLHYGYVDFGADPGPLLHSALIMAAGPAVTAGIGLAGWLWLLKRRPPGFSAAVYAALFFVRFPFNLAMSAGRRILTGEGRWFGGDEAVLSKLAGWPAGIVPLLMGSLGAAVCWFVFARYVPARQKMAFVVTGFCGGCLGFGLWFFALGPRLLP